MQYDARITRTEFHPMVVIPSRLNIWVRIKAFNQEYMLETEKGSIEKLQQKFGFLINGTTYDFTPVHGRECTIEKTELGFRFVRFID